MSSVAKANTLRTFIRHVESENTDINLTLTYLPGVSGGRQTHTLQIGTEVTKNGKPIDNVEFALPKFGVTKTFLKSVDRTLQEHKEAKFVRTQGTDDMFPSRVTQWTNPTLSARGGAAEISGKLLDTASDIIKDPKLGFTATVPPPPTAYYKTGLDRSGNQAIAMVEIRSDRTDPKSSLLKITWFVVPSQGKPYPKSGTDGKSLESKLEGTRQSARTALNTFAFPNRTEWLASPELAEGQSAWAIDEVKIRGVEATRAMAAVKENMSAPFVESPASAKLLDGWVKNVRSNGTAAEKPAEKFPQTWVIDGIVPVISSAMKNANSTITEDELKAGAKAIAINYDVIKASHANDRATAIAGVLRGAMPNAGEEAILAGANTAADEGNFGHIGGTVGSGKKSTTDGRPGSASGRRRIR